MPFSQQQPVVARMFHQRIRQCSDGYFGGSVFPDSIPGPNDGLLNYLIYMAFAISQLN